MRSVVPKTTPADITKAALQSFDHAPSARAKALLQAAVKYLHAFALETNLTTNELIRLAEMLTAAGKISDASRHEFLLMSDVMGLTMVVDYNTNQKPDGAFESSVLGPFYRADAPWIEMGGDICRKERCRHSHLRLRPNPINRGNSDPGSSTGYLAGSN
jgi:hypothetical protein